MLVIVILMVLDFLPGSAGDWSKWTGLRSGHIHLNRLSRDRAARRQILTSAAVAISDAVRKRDTGQELAAVLSPRSSGRSGGSTTASPAVNTDGAEVNLAGT
jgi:hypothetical protein